MDYKVIPTMDMQSRPIGTLVCDDQGVALDFEPADGKPTVLFEPEILHGHDMDTIRQRFINFAFVDDKEQNDDDVAGPASGDQVTDEGTSPA